MTKDQGARDDHLFELQLRLLKQIAAGELSPVEAEAVLHDFMRGRDTTSVNNVRGWANQPGVNGQSAS